MPDSESAYFVARSIEEQALAERSINPAVRRAHLELAERYVSMAADEPITAAHGSAGHGRCSLMAPSHADSTALDMGEASRLQGFRLYGCR